MNVCVITGNLTKDPEVRYPTGEKQTAICRFGLANNEGYGDRKQTNFLNVVVFGKIAENCEKYLKKGSKVAVMGRIQTGSYEKNGQKVYTTDVVAQNVEFLSTAEKKEAGTGWNEEVGAPNGFATLNEDIPF